MFFLSFCPKTLMSFCLFLCLLSFCQKRFCLSVNYQLECSFCLSVLKPLCLFVYFYCFLSFCQKRFVFLSITNHVFADPLRPVIQHFSNEIYTTFHSIGGYFHAVNCVISAGNDRGLCLIFLHFQRKR